MEKKPQQQKPHIPKDLLNLHTKVLKAKMEKQLDTMDYEKVTAQDGFGFTSHHAHHLNGGKIGGVTTTAHHPMNKGKK